jgi:hypothetical protein
VAQNKTKVNVGCGGYGGYGGYGGSMYFGRPNETKSDKCGHRVGVRGFSLKVVLCPKCTPP